MRHRCARGSRDTANRSTSDGRQAGHLQADGDRLVREPRDMLDPPEPLLFDRRDELSVADERRRHVAVIGVEAEDVHGV